ncbi:hydrophobic protein [Pseudonocardiaceae bacterium YIM PH 21723]|nr:hydrophobic protein [Pseudonocardiaceae bacterium YIM PH 21723]
MPIIIAVLLLALLFGGLGFAQSVFWYIAIAVLVIWLLGFVFRGSTAGSRWYRW